MGLLDVLSRNGNDADGLTERYEAELKELEAQFDASLELQQERIAELEFALEDEGWRRLGLEGEMEFSRDGLDKIIRRARLMFLKNPLIRRSVLVQSFYVFGQGMHIEARDERVNEVLQGFWADRRNRKALTGHEAMISKERTLGHDGNVFLALFTNFSTGKVQIRSVPVDEIKDFITDPEDRLVIRYYRRVWTEQRVDPQTGRKDTKKREAYHPDWQYEPQGSERLQRIGGVKVDWETPLMHVKVGGLEHMRFGVPDVYAAMDWASAYKSFLEDWHSIVRSLSRFAWKLKTKSSKVAKAKKKIGTTLGTDSHEKNPPPTAGSTALEDEATELTPIPKTGATVKANDGRQLRLMVAAGTDVPDTMLANDPNMGNLATAKTLDRPTELAMRNRQELWRGVFTDIADYVIQQARERTNGQLRDVSDDLDLTVDVTFPPILERDMHAIVKAIVTAATLDGKPRADLVPTNVIVRELLVALGVQNVDKILKQVADRLGDEVDPDEDGDD